MSDEPTVEEISEEDANLFAKVGEIARKATEDHIASVTAGVTAPALDSYNRQYAVLCGVASALVTCLVGLGDQVGDDAGTQAAALNGVVGQMANIFNEIQARKNLATILPGGTVQ